MDTRVIDFKTEYRPGQDPIDWVLLAPAGPAFDKTRTWHRVCKLMPPEDADETTKSSDSFMAMAGRWKVIGPAYEAWKKGNEIPTEGTPLAAWGGVNASQVEALKKMGIFTVEQVRDMGDAAVSELRMPNARALPKLAGKFLETENVSVKDAKIEELEEKIKVMAEMMEEQKPKRGPGRPKKADSEAA